MITLSEHPSDKCQSLNQFGEHSSLGQASQATQETLPQYFITVFYDDNFYYYKLYTTLITDFNNTNTF